MHPETLLLIGRALQGIGVLLFIAWDPASRRHCSDAWGLIRYRRYFETRIGKWHAALMGVTALAAVTIAIWTLVAEKQMQKAEML